MVYAEGSPEADAYMNKENQAAATLRMRVQNIQLLGGSNKDGQSQGATQNNVTYAGNTNQPVATTPVMSTTPAVDDDLPF